MACIGNEHNMWTLLDRGSAPPLSDEDDPAIVDTAAPAGGKGDGTYKTPSKASVHQRAAKVM
jgi:hypothetical protein